MAAGVHDLLQLVTTSDAWHITLGAAEGSGGSSGNTTIVVALITGLSGVIGVAITAFLEINRRRRRNDGDDPGDPHSPDNEYRKVLRRNVAYELFLGLRGYNPQKIRTGMEHDTDVRV